MVFLLLFKFPNRHPSISLEGIEEMTDIGKTEFVGNFGKGMVRIEQADFQHTGHKTFYQRSRSRAMIAIFLEDQINQRIMCRRFNSWCMISPGNWL